MGIYTSVFSRKKKFKLAATSIFTVFILSWTNTAFSAVAKVEAGDWSEGQKESSSEFNCSTNQFIVARHHSGDENGKTRYKCGTASEGGRLITITDAQWSEGIKESAGTEFICPKSAPVMTGRKHSGDENGTTSYQCSKFIDSFGQDTTPVNSHWSVEMKENNSSFECPSNTVMTGRKHSGDENGQTRYVCSEFH